MITIFFNTLVSRENILIPSLVGMIVIRSMGSLGILNRLGGYLSVQKSPIRELNSLTHAVAKWTLVCNC